MVFLLPELLLWFVNPALALVAYVVSVALFYIRRFNYAALFTLGMYILATIIFYGSSYSVSPISTLGFMAIALLVPLLIYSLELKLALDSFSQFISTLLGIASLSAIYAPFPGPAVGLAYSISASIVSRREVFSNAWLPPLAYAAVYLTSAVLTGTTIGYGLKQYVLSWSQLLTYATYLSLQPMWLFALFGSVAFAIIASVLVPRSLLVQKHIEVHSLRIKGMLRGIMNSTVVTYMKAPRVRYSMAMSFIAGAILSLPAGYLALLGGLVSLFASIIGIYAAAYVSDNEMLKTMFTGILVDIPNIDELKQIYRENWEVLIGMDNMKRELMLASTAFEDKPGVRPIHGILLYGPAGTGKTALGLGYAAWLGLYKGFNVFIVRAGRILRGGPYDAAYRLDLIYRLAEAYQPSVVYIDEIDSLGRVRESPDAPTYLTTSVLLQDIDGVVSRYAKVVTIATTNNKSVLDPALVRPGRLGDLVIYVGKPDPRLVNQIIGGLLLEKERQAPGLVKSIPAELLEQASRTLETGAEAEAFVNCLALKYSLGLTGEYPQCIQAVTSGLSSYY